MYYHIVFRTLQSVPAINEQNEKALYQYIWAFCQQQKCTLHRINGMPDHLHLLVEIHQYGSIGFCKAAQKCQS
ncbi:transposase [Pontibacter rugosus]